MSRKAHKPNENQRAWNDTYTHGMKKNGLRRAHQIASQRQFPYERQGPRCIDCSGPREQRQGLRCNYCQEARQ